MTPAQKAALEAIVRRTLTADEEQQIDALIQSRDDIAIAALLSPGRRVLRAGEKISARGLSELHPGGPLAAEAVVLKLEAKAADLLATPGDSPQAVGARLTGSLLRRQLGFLAADGLDFGSAALRSMLDQFAQSGILTELEAFGLKAVGERAQPLTAAEVSNALNAAG